MIRSHLDVRLVSISNLVYGGNAQQYHAHKKPHNPAHRHHGARINTLAFTVMVLAREIRYYPIIIALSFYKALQHARCSVPLQLGVSPL